MALRASCTVGTRHCRLLPFPLPSDLIPIPDPAPSTALNLPNATSDLQSTIIGIFCSAGDKCNFCSEAFTLSMDSAELTERSCVSMTELAAAVVEEELLEEREAIGLVGAMPELSRYFEMVSKLNL